MSFWIVISTWVIMFVFVFYISGVGGQLTVDHNVTNTIHTQDIFVDLLR